MRKESINMEVVRVEPQGFCKGVIKAMKLINEVVNDEHYPRPLYMLGGLVHNQHIINAYQDLGVKVITSLDDIDHGSVIITAHGASDATKDQILAKGLGLIDATCHDVAKTHALIKAKLQTGSTILFYGKQEHPETKGVLGISPKIILIESLDDINQLSPITGPVALMVQTTMGYQEVLKLVKELKIRIPHLELHHDVCSATKSRQEALVEALPGADLVIIVGDPMSNNTKKLQEVARSNTKSPVILIESINDLLDYDLTLVKRVVVSSGASTPPAIVAEIEHGLNYGLHPSTLTNIDYLQYQKPR